MARFVEVGRKVVNLERVDYFDEGDEGATIVFSGDNRVPIGQVEWSHLRSTLFVPCEGSGEFSAGAIEVPASSPLPGMARRGP